MSFITGWATPDYRTLVSLPERVISVFNSNIQQDDGSEAGGLLLGTVHGSNIALVEATVPTFWDKRFRYLFERLPFGHRGIAETRWRNSGGTIRYLGEWHTHPEDYPTPSSLDRREWAALATKRQDGRPVLAVVVGRCGLHVELMSPVGVGVVLLPIP